MQLKHVLAASAAAIISLGTPALAQVTESGPGSADGNIVVTDGLDLLSNNDNGNNRDNDSSTNDSNNDNSVTDGLDLLSNNDNGNNRDNENYGAWSASRGGEVEDNGNNRDNENYGNGSASRGGEVEDSNNDYSGSVNNDDGELNSGSNVASRGGELNQGSTVASRGGEIAMGNTDVEDSYNQQNGNSSNEIVATQVLLAVNSNHDLDEVADFDGEDDSDSNVGYNSGDNTVRGSSFAAFAGILNQAWNTGLNANTQAATNIAAQGSVSFGDTTGGAGGGTGGD